jgi:phosphohistidine phosphatase
MRRLLLLRHAKSDRPTGVADLERPLNERGAVAARLMGGYVARHGLVPDRVLCSPSRRTRETLAGMASQWADTVNVVYEDRLYAATPKAVIAVICEQEDARTLMVIGHNPELHMVAELLIASGDVAMRERLREKFPTGALAVIDFAAGDWSRIHDRSGRLDRYVTPRSIAAATN